MGPIVEPNAPAIGTQALSLEVWQVATFGANTASAGSVAH